MALPHLPVRIPPELLETLRLEASKRGIALAALVVEKLEGQTPAKPRTIESARRAVAVLGAFVDAVEE